MWVRYRHKFSHGYDEWEWTFLGNLDKERADGLVREELIPRWSAEYDCSEHYRGIDFEILSTAPECVVLQEIESYRNIIKKYEKYIEILLNTAKKHD